MASPRKPYLKGYARLVLLAAVSVSVLSCRENGYDVSAGGPIDDVGGQSGHAGKGAVAGSGIATAGRGGHDGGAAGRVGVNGGTAGRSMLGAGRSTGAGTAIGAGGTGAFGGAAANGGGYAAAGEGLGGESPAAGGVAATSGGDSALGGSAGTSTSTAIGGSTAGSPNTSGGTTSTSTSGGTTSGGGGKTTAGSAGAISNAGSGSCGLLPNPTGDRAKRRMLLRDEGAAKLAFIDVGIPTNSWVVPLVQEQTSGIQGRDMQLVGNCRVMIGTDVGYEEYDIRTGQRLSGVTTFPSTISVQRLRNGNTMVVGIGTAAAPYQSSEGLVLVEVSSTAAVVNKYVYPGTYDRLVRQTPTGTFLVTNNTRVIEGYTTKAQPTDTTNQYSQTTFDMSKVTNCTSANPHVWQALRVPSATAGVTEVVAATGFCASLAFFREDGTVRARITGGTASIAGGATAVNPYFFAGFQLLANGNYLVTNWAGHGTGLFTRGIPVLEYTPSGALAWYWGDPTYQTSLSSIQAVILLDGLDPAKLHVADTSGQLVPVN